MNTNTPYQAPQSQNTDTNQAAPALWNPNAAIAWSIPMALVSGALLDLLNNAVSENFMFTPNIKLFLIFAHVFAAAIHMLNARAMGDTGLKRRNFGFILATPFVLAIIAPLSFFPLFAILGSLLLPALWYATTGRRQTILVKERYGANYPRRPWPKALLLGFLGTTALIALVGIAFLSLVVTIIMLIFGH